MVTYEQVRENPNIRTYIQRADESLIALGYTSAEAAKSVAHVADQASDVNQLIFLALKGGSAASQ